MCFFFFLYLFFFFFFFFFFSSRRRHTRWNCDWSSGVLFRSEVDLVALAVATAPALSTGGRVPDVEALTHAAGIAVAVAGVTVTITGVVARVAITVAERVHEIGRASCRERVYIAVVGGSCRRK